MKIGLLLPTSRYYPYIGNDLYNTIKHLLGEEHTYIIKDTNIAVPADNQKAIKELILFDNADLIIGYIGYKSLTAIQPLLLQTQTPLIICSPGDHPILKADVNPYIIHCSLDMFNSIYLACKWAFQNIGSEYSRMLSFFEAGFPLALATETAANQYSGNILLTETTHKDRNTGLEASIRNVLNKNNDFIFVGYHGFEGIEALENYSKIAQENKTPLIASPFITDTDLKLPDLSTTIYTVNTWRSANNEASGILNSIYQEHLNREPNFSSILAYEAAQIIKHCLINGWKAKKEIAPLLKDLTINSPRGEVKFNSLTNSFIADYNLVEVKYSEENRSNIATTIDTIKPNEKDQEILNSFTIEASGWQNTYLCN